MFDRDGKANDEKQKTFFNKHAEKWLDRWYRDPVTGEMNKHEKDFERLFSMIPLSDGQRVVDVGCGTGVLVPYIQPLIGGQGILYEIDFAEKMIEENRRLHDAPNVVFLATDIKSAPIDPESIDVAICFSCFPHFRDKKTTMCTLQRMLKPGGMLIVSHFSSSHDLNNMHRGFEVVNHDMMPGEEEMRALHEGAGFDIRTFIDETGYYYIESVKK